SIYPYDHKDLIARGFRQVNVSNVSDVYDAVFGQIKLKLVQTRGPRFNITKVHAAYVHPITLAGHPKRYAFILSVNNQTDVKVNHNHVKENFVQESCIGYVTQHVLRLNFIYKLDDLKCSVVAKGALFWNITGRPSGIPTMRPFFVPNRIPRS